MKKPKEIVSGYIVAETYRNGQTQIVRVEGVAFGEQGVKVTGTMATRYRRVIPRSALTSDPEVAREQALTDLNDQIRALERRRHALRTAPIVEEDKS